MADPVTVAQINNKVSSLSQSALNIGSKISQSVLDCTRNKYELFRWCKIYTFHRLGGFVLISNLVWVEWQV